MTETLAYGYSSESTLWELSNEYQHDRVQMAFNNLYISFSAFDESSLSIGRVKCGAHLAVQWSCVFVR